MSWDVGLQLLYDGFRSQTVFVIYFEEIRVQVDRHQVIFSLKLEKVCSNLCPGPIRYLMAQDL